MSCIAPQPKTEFLYSRVRDPNRLYELTMAMIQL
jgi:hypothetical protein